MWIGVVPVDPVVGGGEWPQWSVVAQSRFDVRQRRTVYWVDVHMGPGLWRVVDWAGYEAAWTLLRNLHRTAVVVFCDGGRC